MLPSLILGSVNERDVDLLVLEELTVNRSFTEKFLHELELENLKEWKVFHSVTERELGESDLILWTKLLNAQTKAVMIENKIDAPAQRNQANRYKARGEIGIQNNDWDSFVTCMIAPERYLQGTGDAKLYDYQVSYERIIEILEEVEGIEKMRRRHKKEILKLGIEQQRRGYTAIIDERVSDFWQSYYQLAAKEFPILKMPMPQNKPGGAGFIKFKPDGLAGKGFILRHKFKYGKMDLQTTWSSDELIDRQAEFEETLEPDMEIKKTGKSCSISIRVGLMDSQKSFIDQEETARNAMHHALRLVEFSKFI
jgi:hypothetical protein